MSVLKNLNILNLQSIKEPGAPAGLEQAAADSARIGRESLDFYKGEFDDIKALTDQVVQSYLRTQEQQTGMADEFTNYMKSFGREVMAEGSPQQQEEEAARARAQVAGAHESARASTGRDLARMGVNPNSGRFGDFTLRSGLNQASDEAGAMNTARTDARLRGTALRAGVLPGISNAATQLGMQAGGAAIGAQTVPSSVMDAGFRTALTGAGQAGGLYSNIYSGAINTWANKLQEQRLQKDQRSEIAQDWVGAGFAMSSRKAKDKTGEVKSADIIRKVRTLPVDRWRYKEEVSPDQDTHIGPYAEDFKERFGVGDGKVIRYIDAIGVNFAAVKGLAEQVERLQSRVATIAREGVRYG